MADVFVRHALLHAPLQNIAQYGDGEVRLARSPWPREKCSLAVFAYCRIGCGEIDQPGIHISFRDAAPEKGFPDVG